MIPIITTRSGRLVKPAQRLSLAAMPIEYQVYATSLKRLMQMEDRKAQVKASILEEIDNLMAPGIMEATSRMKIQQEHIKGIIKLWMFHKEKYDSKGKFIKDKCRIVTLSQHRDTSMIGQTYSPTVNPISFFVTLAITAKQPKYILSSYDVKGAFLNSLIPESIYIYVESDKALSDLFVEKYPNLSKHRNTDGTLIFRLRRYLYGLQESPLAWNKTLHQCLVNMQFKQSIADQCAYTSTTKYGIAYLTVHVDDMLLASPSKDYREQFESELKKYFQIVIQHDDITYLAMSVSKNNEGISVHQIGYIETLGIKFGVDSEISVTSPTSSDFMEYDESDEDFDKTKFLSLVMSLMFLARFTRSDILMPVTFLATKSANPKEKDYQKLLKILGYAMTTRKRRLLFESGNNLTLHIYADAAHMLHKDSKGHGGIIGTLGSAPIFVKSFKLKLVTRSSTESELVCLDEAVTFAIWLISLMKDLIPSFTPPVTILQDNLSTIAIVQNGGNFNRSKHLINKYHFIKQHIDRKDIILKYCSSQEMIADMVSKPLEVRILKILCKIACLVE
jgi:hypothetical protein